jgi:hypothetical protein
MATWPTNFTSYTLPSTTNLLAPNRVSESVPQKVIRNKAKKPKPPMNGNKDEFGLIENRFQDKTICPLGLLVRQWLFLLSGAVLFYLHGATALATTVSTPFGTSYQVNVDAAVAQVGGSAG